MYEEIWDDAYEVVSNSKVDLFCKRLSNAFSDLLLSVNTAIKKVEGPLTPESIESITWLHGNYDEMFDYPKLVEEAAYDLMGEIDDVKDIVMDHALLMFDESDSGFGDTNKLRPYVEQAVSDALVLQAVVPEVR